jgi:hypothetical protein
MATPAINPAPQGPPPGAVPTPIASAAPGPPPGAVATPIAPPTNATATPITTTAPQPATPPQAASLYGKIKGYVDQAKKQQADAMDQHPVLKAIDNIVSAPENANVGAVRGMALTAGGLAHIARKVTGTTGSETGAEKGVQEFGEGGDTYAEEAGKWIESAGEFMLGDAALKGLPYVDKLRHITPILKLAEKSPIVAKALDAAIQQGIIGGTQAYAKSGGDAKHAAETGAVTGATGGLLTAAGGKIGEMLANRAPATENIAGEGVQTLSSQRPGAGPRGNVTTAEVPKVAAAQQAAAPRVFRNVASRATQKALDEANVGRAIPGQITDPARMLPAPEGAKPYPFTIEGPGATSKEVPGGNTPRVKQIGTEYVAGKGSGTAAKTEPYNEGAFKYGDEEPLPPVSDTEPFQGPTHKEPILQYLTDLKPGQTGGSTSVTGGGDMVAAGPEAAQTHLSRLNDLVDHPPAGASPEQLQAITSARDSLQEQMDMYHSYQRTLPNFQPIDSARAAAGVGHFGEAEDQLENAAKPIYQKIDAATDGQFGKLNRLKAGAAKRGDFEAKYDYEDKIDKLIADSQAISPAERQQATKLWSTSKVLGGFHDIIERAANVSDDYAGQVSGGRTISGTKLQNGLKSMISRYGTDRLEGVVGRDGMENMTRMADLLKTQPQSKIQAMSMNLYHNLAHGKIGAAIGIGVGAHLGGYEGAAAGALVGSQAERAVLRYVATNPRVGQLFDYAVRNDVTPKVAAGLIAAEIQREHAEPEQTEEKEDKPQ